MKKKQFIIVVLLTIFLAGCQLNNNPTSKAEELLSKYQMLDKDIKITYTDLISDTNISSENQKEYEKLIRKQYRNLSYEIKNEEIDGDSATITCQIKVTNYKKIFDEYSKTNNSNEEYHKQMIEALKKGTEKITYTIDIEVKKDKEGNWIAQSLTTEEKQKILGMK